MNYHQITWYITDEEEDDSPRFDEPKPEPLHKRRSIFVTGVHDLLSKADSSALGILCIAASLHSNSDKNSLYCTKI